MDLNLISIYVLLFTKLYRNRKKHTPHRYTTMNTFYLLLHERPCKIANEMTKSVHVLYNIFCVQDHHPAPCNHLYHAFLYICGLLFFSTEFCFFRSYYYFFVICIDLKVYLINNLIKLLLYLL